MRRDEHPVRPLSALSAEEERRLVEEAAAGSASAADRLVRAHAHLAYKLAYRYRRFGAEMAEDLVGEAMLALVEALRRFDPERGGRFCGYAGLWVEARLRAYTLRSRQIVNAPRTRAARHLFGRLRAEQRGFEQLRGRPPTPAEVAEALGVTERDVHEVEAALGGASLPVDTCSGAGVPGCDLGSPEEAALLSLDGARAAERVRLAMGELLTRRERAVLRRRYPRGEPECGSYASIGRDLGFSRTYAQMLEEGAVGKLRGALSA